MSLSEQATTYMVAAVRAYGEAVLSAGQAPDVDAGVLLGQRLMHQIFGIRDPEERLPRVVEGLITHPEDGSAAEAELADHLWHALSDDPDLEAAVSRALITSYQREIAAGNLQAMVDLGDLLQWREDYDGARAAYQRAVEAGNTHALIDLAHLLHEDLDDAEGARAAFREAADAGYPMES